MIFVLLYNMVEEWRHIKGVEKSIEKDYLISNTGKVKSLISDRILKPSVHKHTGYARQTLRTDKGTYKSYLIHRLVAMTFVDNPENKPVVNHKDSNRLNNYFNNLEWCTNSENIKHAIKNGRFNQIYGKDKKQPFQFLSEKSIQAIRDLYLVGWSQDSISEVFGCSRSYVSEVVNNKKRASS